MNKRTTYTIGGIVVILAVFAGLILLDPENGPSNEDTSKQISSVTQQEIKKMVEDWMNNPDEDDTEQRLEIMRAFYSFEESGQWFSDDQEGRVLYNQIIKMVSFDIPKTELDQIRQDVREKFGE